MKGERSRGEEKTPAALLRMVGPRRWWTCVAERTANKVEDTNDTKDVIIVKFNESNERKKMISKLFVQVAQNAKTHQMRPCSSPFLFLSTPSTVFRNLPRIVHAGENK